MTEATARPGVSPARISAEPPATLLGGRYRLLERLDLGATAEVWRALDEDLDRDVAVKLLHEHLLRDDVARRRVQREALAAARLSHPGIVTVYDVLVSDDRAAIVMELVRGETLRVRLDREAPLLESDAVTVVSQVAHALAHAHAEHVIHRDVKPGNVMVDDQGRARLIDFGIARELEDEALRMTLTGTVIGTLHYLAPEQLAGDGASAASDVYSLGVVLYEALAGRPPFPASRPALLVAAQSASPDAIPGVSDSVQGLCRAALAPDPGARPTAVQLAAALESFAVPTDATRVAAVPVAAVRRPTLTAMVAFRVSTARMVAIAVGAATGILSAAVLLIVLASLR